MKSTFYVIRVDDDGDVFAYAATPIADDPLSDTKTFRLGREVTHNHGTSRVDVLSAMHCTVAIVRRQEVNV